MRRVTVTNSSKKQRPNLFFGLLAVAVCGAVFISVLGAVAGCGPTYPNCKSDDDCNPKDNPRHEFCVNQTCQKCRNDKDCADGSQCKKARCEIIPDYCADDGKCGDGVCKDHRCTTCADDGQCGDGGRCSKGKCIRKGQCEKDDDCAENQDCKAGKCVSAAPETASQDAACKLQAIFFDFNESVLTTEATDAIDANAKCIRKVGRAAQMIGRSDPRGTEEYNLALSERRAQSVRERLLRLGLNADKLRVLGKGELDATGTEEAGWAHDRRVDFQWM